MKVTKFATVVAAVAMFGLSAVSLQAQCSKTDKKAEVKKECAKAKKCDKKAEKDTKAEEKEVKAVEKKVEDVKK